MNGARGPRPTRLDSWLRRMVKAHAARIRVVLENETEKLVAVDVKGRTPRVQALLRTIESIPSAERLEALLEDGTLVDVWQIEEGVGDGASEVPGYAKDPDDTEPERLLKTFAHLLADAHKQAARQLVEVVSIQSASFTEERRHLSGAMQATDRLLARLGKTRVRVADASEVEDEGTGESDNFIQEFLGPMLRRAVREEVSGASKTTVNGAASSAPSSGGPVDDS